MNKYEEALFTFIVWACDLAEFIPISLGDNKNKRRQEFRKDIDKCTESLRELVVKATKKKVIVNGIREGRQINTVSYTCPNCNNHIGRDNFCKYCGQALDWSNDG